MDTELGVRLSVVVPVFNELGNLDEIVDRVHGVLDGLVDGWELILVDDGSTDGSGERLDLLAADDDHVSVLHFERNCGQSAAMAAGLTASRGELVAILDADLQTYPEDLPKLLSAMTGEGVDAVVGVREERRDSRWRRFSSWFANGVRNRLTREDIIDTGCPIKLFRGAAIRSLRPWDGMHRFLPTLLKMEGFPVIQVSVRHTHRRAGESKYGTLDRAFRGLRDALGVRWLQDRTITWRLR
jgi:glycosyltransferase involved in cell wall biosynthesis